MRQANDIHREETRQTEGKQAGIQDKFLKDPQYQYYVDEMVSSTMKNFFDKVNFEHHKATIMLDDERAQMLRALDEGIDPVRNSEYQRKKHSLESKERARLSEIRALSLIRDDIKYEEEARARRRQCPQNNPPWEWGCSHGSYF